MLTPQAMLDAKNTAAGIAERKDIDSAAGVPVSPEAPASAEHSKVNILLVDDTPENLIALEAVLYELGQNLVKARSGEEALRLILRQDFAVILLDVNMPGISGFETAQLIRQRKSTEHIPIIFVTAISTSDTHLFKGYSLGAVDYIFTPVIPDVLRSKVNVFVELLKKTEEAKRQAEQLRLMEEREHRQRLSEAARRLELQTKQNRFFTLSVDLLAIADFAGHLKELNAAWERLLGYSENDLKGNPFWEWMDPAEKEIAQSRLREAIQDRNTVNFECSYRCRDGSNRWFAWTLAPYGAEELLYLFARDITGTKIAEKQIRKLNQTLEQRAEELQSANAELQTEVSVRKKAEEALQESNSALEAFSYSVSHDLRAPIRAMQGFAKVLLEDYSGSLDEMGRDCATRIVHAADRMDNLVHDLLVFSRLGHTTLELRPISLQETLLEVLGHLEGEVESRQASINIEPDLPSVLAHDVTLTQILVNLISNGMKFVPAGVTPRITVRSEKEADVVRLWIEDNGIGIPSEDQSRIFKVFERLHGADSYPGTGLGLAIVRKGVERMSGQVGVESEVGKGSHFWLRLKLSDSSNAS
jgi:PAS domain S-box-containing protein